jgi:hypothetical protein
MVPVVSQQWTRLVLPQRPSGNRKVLPVVETLLVPKPWTELLDTAQAQSSPASHPVSDSNATSLVQSQATST